MSDAASLSAAVEHLLSLADMLGAHDYAAPQPQPPYRTMARQVYTPGAAAAQVKGFR